MEKSPPKPSRTAEATAVCRAMACLDDRFRSHGVDRYAKHFIKPITAAVIRSEFIRERIKRRFLTPGVYAYLVARTRHFDRLFQSAARGNDCRQILLIGAGYDTRALRLQIDIGTTRVFEIDTPCTQQRKKRLIQKAGIAWPAQAILVSADLAHTDPSAVLADTGYDPTAKTLVLMEGLLMYLQQPAVDRLLSDIRKHTGSGSTVAFDYCYREVMAGTSMGYGAKEQWAAVTKVGEPFRFGLDHAAVGDFLADRGYRLRDHYAPAEFESTYLSDGNGGVVEPIYHVCGNAVADLAD